MKRLLLTLIGVFAMLGLMAPLAHADSYTDDLANKLGPTVHVVADPSATPPLPNPDEIDRQIKAANVPIYVVAVAPGQTDKTTPDTLRDALSARIGKDFSGILLVIDSKGYHVRAYHVSKQVADQVDPMMGSAAKEHKGDLYGAVSAFVSKVASLRVPASGPTATSAPAAKPVSYNTGWWVFAGILGVGSLLGLGVWGFRGIARGRQKQRELANEVDSGVIEAQSRVDDLGNAVLYGEDVSAEHMKAILMLADAREARDAGKLSQAMAHLRTLKPVLDAADKKLNPDITVNWEDVRKTPPSERKKATVSVTTPSGERVTVDNSDFRNDRAPGYRHYYGGGVRNGMYFDPGYYPYPVGTWGWDPTAVIVTSMLLDDHHYHEHHHEPTFTSPEADVDFEPGFTDTNWDTDSEQADVSFEGDSSHSSGDRDFSGSRFAATPSSSKSDDDSSSRSYSSRSDDTPSYTSPSTSSYDFGGGSSFGGDSGGGFSGGSDSGGGSYGF